MQTVSTQHYEVKLEPLRAEGYNYYNQFRYTLTNGIIPAGENGMSIAVLKDGKVLRKRILVTITLE